MYVQCGKNKPKLTQGLSCNITLFMLALNIFNLLLLLYLRYCKALYKVFKVVLHSCACGCVT